MTPMLRLVRPLPPQWDGRHVEWDPLALMGGSLDLHLPWTCPACGTIAAPWRAGGRILSDPAPHTGRRHHVVALHAERCTTCLHDAVSDRRTGESWDLGPEDYGPSGSCAVTGSLW